MKKNTLPNGIKKAVTLVASSSLLSPHLNGQIADQLTSYWSFDNTLEDTAGNLSGSANTTDDDLSTAGSGFDYGLGRFGGAGYSGNGNGHVQVADSADVDEGNGTISISLWARVENLNTNWQAMISKGENDNYRIARRNNTNNVAFSGGNGDIFSNPAAISNPVAIDDGQWHHIVGTSGPSGTILYVDGNLVDSDGGTVDLTNSNNPLFIGNNPDAPGRQWDGEIDDVALWHRELSLSDVQEIYNAGQADNSLADIIGIEGGVPGISPFSDELTAYWNFDSTLDDQAGNFPGNASTVEDNLTLQGSGSQLSTSGLFGGAYTGNGNGYASTSDSFDVDENDDTISISVWARVEDFDRAWQTLLSKGEGANYRISRFQDSEFVNGRVGSTDFSSAPLDIDDGLWHHIVATAGPSGSLIYIDGNLAPNSNTAPSVLTNSNNELWIGNNPEAEGREWDGDIDDLALWHRELTADEVTAIYQAGIDAQNPQSLGELILATSNDDNDEDGLPDEWEISFGLSFALVTGAQGDNGASGDPDGDLLSNLDEFLAGTSPILADTDQDGLWDGAEVSTHGTDPTLADSDGDGASDGDEILFGTDPTLDTSTPAAGQTSSGVQTVGSLGPYLDGVLPTLEPSATQNSNENWTTVDAFPALNFGSLKGIVSEPRSTNLHVIERGGTLQQVDVLNPNSMQEVLDISSLTENGDNGGLRSVVFHPDYNLAGSPNRNFLYCFYSTTAQANRGFSNGDGSFFYRLSRFTRDESSGNFQLNSELVLIQHFSADEGQHFGGSLGFDPDGFLWIGLGDMEFNASRVGAPFYQDSQRIDRTFQAGILRIDVDNQGGSISHAATRTLQGSNGDNAVPNSSQSIDSNHRYFHEDNMSGVHYMIPSDNYFVLNPPSLGVSIDGTPLHGDALEEYQALGTRNPWRMAIDPVDGDVALFNVGSNQGANFEEVELVRAGYNGGWPYLEGEVSQTSETGRSPAPSQYNPTTLGTETAPLVYWDHGTGRIASGGTFYYGGQWPTINQQLLFGDHSRGQIWAIDYKSSGAPASDFVEVDDVNVPSNYSVRILVDTSIPIRQMATGPTGQDIYIAGDNNVYRLINTAAPNPEAPALLSQTGAFTDLATLTPRAGLIPFEPASELWSDRAAKQRWIAVPNEAGIDGEYDQASEKITYSEEGEWAYPIGTVFIKHFALPSDLLDPDNPDKLTPVETRFSVRSSEGDYFFFTYRWRADGSDADLISDAESGTIPITDLNGLPSNQIWDYPSRSQCFECHQSSSGSVLGMKSRQLNHSILYPSTGQTANQLTTFANLGLFDQGPDFGSLDNILSSVSIDDVSESWEMRVRSYLDSNCSYCHRPGSNADRAEFDALLTTPLGLSEIINGTVNAENLGVADASIVTPGHPEQSILYLRDSSTDPSNMMPPVGRRLNDTEYLAVLETWIGTIGLTEYIAWAQSQGIDTGLTGDADNDGHLNVFEFTFLQDGQNPDISSLPEIIVAGDTAPSIQIPVSGAALTDGFQVLVEGSDDLQNWYPLGDSRSGLETVSNSSSPGTDGVLEITITSDSERQFLRYGVIIP